MKFSSKRLVALACAITPFCAAQAVDVNWISNFDGFWDISSNWSPRLPQAGDNVILDRPSFLLTVTFRMNTVSINKITANERFNLTGGILTLAGTGADQSVFNQLLTFSAGTLNGAGDMVANSSFNWSGGTLGGAGTLTLNAPSAFNPVVAMDLQNRAIINKSAITHSSNNSLRTGNGASITNETGASYTFNGDGDLLFNLGGLPTSFVNNGSIVKSAGSATTQLTMPLTNNGLLRVDTGTFELAGNSSHAGTLQVQSGATAHFGTGLHSLSGVVTGAGSINFATNQPVSILPGANYALTGTTTVSSGAVDFDAATTFAGPFRLIAGAFDGSATVRLTNGFEWTGGTLTGSGLFILDGPNQEVNAPGNADIQGKPVENRTTLALKNTGNLRVGQGTVFTNNPGALFDFQSDADFLASLGGSVSSFNNAGTVRKSAGTGTSALSAVFNNTGLVEVQSGRLDLSGGGASNGQFSISAGATLAFMGQTHTLTGTVLGPGNVRFELGTVNLSQGMNFNPSGTTTIAGSTVNFETNFSAAGPVVVSSGTLQGSGQFNVNGPFTWLGGTIQGDGVLNVNNAATLNTEAGNLDARSRTINFAGATTLSGGANVRVGAGATLNNLATGVFSIAGDTDIVFTLGGSSSPFNNSGAFRKQSGAGITAVSAPFNNSGSAVAEAGTLEFSGGGNSSGTFSAVAGATLSFNGGTHTLTGALQGLGRLLFDAGTVNLNSGAVVAGLGTTEIDGAVVNWNVNSTLAGPLTVKSGTLQGDGAVVANGAFTWSGGVLAGAGALTVNSVATLDSAVNTLDINARTVTFANTTTFSGLNALRTGSAANLNIAPTGNFQISGDSDLNNNLGGSPSNVNVFGQFRKTSGTGVSTVNQVFNNSGQTVVEAGTLALLNGGVSSGAFSAASGATLSFENGTHTLTGQVTGAGVILFDGGIVNLAAGSNYNVTGQTIVDGSTTNFLGAVTSLGSGLVVRSGVANLSSNAVTNSALSLIGGTLTGTAAVTFTGSINWTGGSMTGNGTTAFNGGALNTTSASLDFTERTLSNTGTLVLLGANAVRTGTGAVFNNQLNALFDFQSDGDVLANLGGAATNFNNLGTLRKSAGTGVSQVSMAVNNSGSVQAQIGRLELNGGGTSTGSFQVSVDADLVFGGGTHTLSGPISGGGDVIVSQGTANFNAGSVFNITGTTQISGGTANFLGSVNSLGTNVSISAGTANFSSNAVTNSSLSLSGGSLTGTADATFSEPITWTGGSVSGAGKLTVNGGTMNASAINLDMTFRTVENTGTLVLTGNTSLRGGNGATLVNRAGALFDIQSDADLFANLGGTTAAVNNAGTLRKSGGNGTSTISMILNNTGAAQAQSGTLELTGGGAGGGSFTVSNGSTLNFAGGTWNLTGPMTGAGAVIFGGGTVNLNSGSTLNVTGNVRFAGGTVNVGGSVASVGPVLDVRGGTANFSSNAFTVPAFTMIAGNLQGTSNITVTGLTNWSGGSWRGAGQLVLNGGGALNSTANYLDIYERTVTFRGNHTVTGTLGLRSGTGATLIIPANGSLDFAGDGDLQHSLGGTAGVLNLNGVLTKSAGTGLTTISVPINNNGTLDVKTGTVHAMATPVGFLNGALSTGTWRTSSVLRLGVNITTLGAALELDSSNAVIYEGASGTTSALRNLASIAATGRLALRNGAVQSLGMPLVNNGQISVGKGSTLTVNNQFWMGDTGKLTIEAGGMQAGQTGRMAVQGRFNANGELAVTLAPDYTPAPGDVITLVTYGQRAGTFDTISLPPLPGGLAANIVEGPTSITITFSGGLVGDTDNSGCVDDADLTNIILDFGAAGGSTSGFPGTDTNGDGIVDDADLTDLILNFGVGC